MSLVSFLHVRLLYLFTKYSNFHYNKIPVYFVELFAIEKVLKEILYNNIPRSVILSDSVNAFESISVSGLKITDNLFTFSISEKILLNQM